MKKLSILLVTILGLLLLSGCSEIDLTDVDVSNIDYTDTSEDLTDEEIDTAIDNALAVIDEDGINLDKEYETITSDEYIVFTGDSITAGGAYYLSGVYTGITIDTTEEVTLLLDNATITSVDGPAINVLDADDVTISSLEGTSNVISDTFIYSSQDYNASIYSKSDLIFNGTGTLTVNGNYNNAINCKDDIRIVESTLIINSVDDGVIGKDYIAIKNATITINSTGDAIKSSNDEAADKGFIYIKSGTFIINTDADGLQAVNSVIIYGGTFTISSGDDCITSDIDITIGGGTFDLDSEGDAINAANSLTIYDGDFTINSGDDGLHSDLTIVIEGGTINIDSSYEGIEAYEIFINGGVINVNSVDDGINGTTGGGQIHAQSYISTGGYFEMNGGIVTVNSVSDGVDINGSGVVNDGYLIVFGCTEDNQSSIDFDESFDVNGGVVIALGSIGMIQSFSTTSTQASLMFASASSYSSGTTISLLDSDDNTIVTLDAVKEFAGITLSTEELVIGSSYTLVVDGDETDFTISSSITTLGVEGAGEGSMGGFPGGTPPRR